MRFLLILFSLLLWQACCNASCDCEDDCKKSYLFTLVQGSGHYAPEDIDTLEVSYKFEETREFDTAFFYRINAAAVLAP